MGVHDDHEKGESGGRTVRGRHADLADSGNLPFSFFLFFFSNLSLFYGKVLFHDRTPTELSLLCPGHIKWKIRTGLKWTQNHLI